MPKPIVSINTGIIDSTGLHLLYEKAIRDIIPHIVIIQLFLCPILYIIGKFT